MQISGLIRDLERIKDKHGDCKVLIGQTNYRHGGHTYSISDYLMEVKVTEDEPKYTCDEGCSNPDADICNDPDCPTCACQACNLGDTNDEMVPVVYLMEGDQNAYALPSELMSVDHV